TIGKLDAAGLSPAAGQHLGFDHDRPPEFLGGGASLFRSGCKSPFRDGDAEARKQLLALILVEVHGRGECTGGHAASAAVGSGDNGALVLGRRVPRRYTRARVPTRVGVVTHHPLESTIPRK